jgi:hypothetical protein
MASFRRSIRSVASLLAHHAVGGLSIAVLITVGVGSVLNPAEAAKVPPVAANPKAEVVDGIPLAPITVNQRDHCQKLANHLKRRAPCPGLLPVPIPVSATSAAAQCLGTIGEGACGPAATQVMGNILLLSQSNFQVPPGYVGVTFEQSNGTVVPMPSVNGGSLGHFVFMAGSHLQTYLRNKAGRNTPPVPRYCSQITVATSIRVHDSAAKLYQCSDSRSGPDEIQLLTGHDLLVWQDAGITCEVSFHGHSQVNVDLDIAEANATTLVAPTRR